MSTSILGTWNSGDQKSDVTEKHGDTATPAWKAKDTPIFKATGLLVLGVKLPKKIGHLAFQAGAGVRRGYMVIKRWVNFPKESGWGRGEKNTAVFRGG